jgi:pimeloyl-ACP methyl ester carboxylesterase
MTFARVNGVRLYFEEHGRGEPMVLVHGSWGDHHNWDAVVPGLAASFRVVTYDRRGHSQSERPATQGRITEDAEDLAALIEHLGITPAHVVGNSGGGIVSLALATMHPELFRTLIVHEPPLFPLLAGKPGGTAVLDEVGRRIAAVVAKLEAGEDEAGARLFVETIAFGPGAWDQLPAETRKTFTFNAPTFLDEIREKDGLMLDLNALRRFSAPALLSVGTTSAPFFPAVVGEVATALPHAARHTFTGAGHVPHITHPAEYVETVSGFARHDD